MDKNATFKTEINGKNVGFSLRRRLIHGTKWSIIGAVVVQGMGLVAGIIVARVIGKVDFGKYGIINSTVGMFGVFGGMAMGLTSTKHIAQFRNSDPERAGRFVGLPIAAGLISSLLVALVVFIFSDIIAKKILNDINLCFPLRIGVLLLVFNTVSNIQMAGLAGLESFKPIAKGNFIISIFTLPCISIGAWIFGLSGAIAGLVISRLVACVVFGVFLNKSCKVMDIPISYGGLHKEWSTLWGFSLPTFLAGMMIGPANWFCNVLLVNQPGGFAQMGIYNATLQWQAAIQFVPMRILNVTLPVLSDLYEKRDLKRYFELIKIGVLSIIAMSFVVAIPIMIMSRYIMFAYGKDFIGGSLVLVLMIVAASLLMSVRMLSQVAQSRGKAWIDFLFCGLYSVVLIIIWLLLLKYGALGLAASICIAYLIMNIGLAIYTFSVKRKESHLLKEESGK